MGPLLSSRGRAARSPSPSPVPGPLASEFEPLLNISPRGTCFRTWSARSCLHDGVRKGEPVSLSRRRVVRQKRPTAYVTASPIPPSQRRDLGRARLHSASLVIPVSYLNSYKMSRVYLFDRYQTNNVCLLGMIGRPLGRASCQSPKPKGSAEGAEIDSERARQATIGLP